MMGQDPNSPRKNIAPSQQQQQHEVQQQQHQQHQHDDTSFVGTQQYPQPATSRQSTRLHPPEFYPQQQQQQQASQQHQQQQQPAPQQHQQQFHEYPQFYPQQQHRPEHYDTADTGSTLQAGHYPTRLSSSFPGTSYTEFSSSLPVRSYDAPAAAAQSLSSSPSTSYSAMYEQQQQPAHQTEYEASTSWRPPQQQPPPPQGSHGTAWQPRATSAPAVTPVPMFGERLQQRASMQLGNIPHIPNIVVDAVPARDNFGHSRTPPFVQSDWTGQWGLSVPTSSKKLRTNSDSAIYEAEREEQHQRKGGYIPSSWELLSFRDSQDSPKQEHIKTVAAEASSQQLLLEQSTYHKLSRSREAPSAAAGAPPSSSSYLSHHGSPQPQAMDVEEQQALNLTHVPPQQPPPVSPPGSKTVPTVPFLWKFHAQKSSESPKSTWLRRHSDSTLPTEPEDLSVPKSSARSRSSGETISEERSAAEQAVDTGDSGGTTGGSTSGTDGGELHSPKDPQAGGSLLSKRLKLKKYLQKRYQLSLESTPRHHSTESDDVFSPSPGIFGSSQGFVFSPTLTEDEISPRPQRPSPLASTSRSSPSRTLPQAEAFSKPLKIKTEPISPISSESEEETDAGVFLSPAYASPQSVSPSSQGIVFQFHSPTSYSRSSGSDKSPDSSHRHEGKRSMPQRSPESISQSPSTVSETVAMESSHVSSPQTSTSEPPNVEIVRQGRLSPLASMLSHPSFTHPNVPTFSAPLTPPFGSYQTKSSTITSEQGSAPTAAGSAAWPPHPAAAAAQPARARSMSETDKPLEPSKIIYCPFSEKVQEQRYQREMTFLCPVCGQMFPSYNYLANHMVNHLPSEVVTKGPGEGNKVHLCKVCNRSFSRSDMLTRHMRLHTGLRPYECRMCGQVFSRSDHLHTHLRTHTGEKPYRCPQCPYAAPRRDMITRHMRIHTKHFSRRGRRSSSTGSADTLQSSSFSSLESGDSDVKKRNQSLSSMGSEGSTEASPFRRTSGASFDPIDPDTSRSRPWSLTSADSIDSGADLSTGTPTRKYSRKWSLTSIESVDIPPSSGGSSAESSHLSLMSQQQSSQRTSSAASMESGEAEEQGMTSMDTGGRETPGGAEQEMQSSFQKCRVGSDRESESEHTSPAHVPHTKQQP